MIKKNVKRDWQKQQQNTSPEESKLDVKQLVVIAKKKSEVKAKEGKDHRKEHKVLYENRSWNLKK